MDLFRSWVSGVRIKVEQTMNIPVALLELEITPPSCCLKVDADTFGILNNTEDRLQKVFVMFGKNDGVDRPDLRAKTVVTHGLYHTATNIAPLNFFLLAVHTTPHHHHAYSYSDA